MARGRILLVEDEPLLHYLWEDICEDNDIELVGPAMSNAEAHEHINREGASLCAVFLDVNLQSEMSTSTAELLATTGIPVIVCSGSHGTELPEIYQQWPVLEKPYRPSEVEALLQKLVCS